MKLSSEMYEAMMPVIMGETIADVVDAMNEIITALKANDYQ